MTSRNVFMLRDDPDDVDDICELGPEWQRRWQTRMVRTRKGRYAGFFLFVAGPWNRVGPIPLPFTVKRRRGRW